MPEDVSHTSEMSSCLHEEEDGRKVKAFEDMTSMEQKLDMKQGEARTVSTLKHMQI